MNLSPSLPETASKTILEIGTPDKTRITSHKIAVIIPCYNEELTIAQVVKDFKSILPQSDIYVYDNNSIDHTVEKARQSGAIVCYERRQGKGFVVQRMFREIDADVYVMVDGDNTYPPKEV